MAKKILKIVLSVLTVLLFLLSLAVIIVGSIAVRDNKMINIFGYAYSVVPTESMVPDINPGDFVISKRVPFSDENIAIGTDIIYYSEENQIYIVHRVIEGNAQTGFTTKGINNTYKDSELVTEANFIAVVKTVWDLGFLGKMVANYRSVVFLIVGLIFVMIIVNEGFTLAKLKAESDKEKKQTEEQAKIERLKAEIMAEILEEKEKK